MRHTLLLCSALLALAKPLASQAATYLVTNTLDAGPGSLRQAVLDANATAAADTIAFNIPGAAPHTIALQAGLPDVLQRVTIDGTTQPGYAGRPIIVLNGSAIATPNVDGLFISAANSAVKGLVVQGFSGDGIILFLADASVVQGCYLGTDWTGTVAVPNEQSGIDISESSDILIGGTNPAERNLISGNRESGVYIAGTTSKRNDVLGNFIGTAVSGYTALPNRLDGVTLDEGEQGQIGSAALGAGNLISGNNDTGVFMLFSTTKNKIHGNYIGTGPDGITPVANRLHGVQVDGSNANQIGGTVASQGNVIAYNSTASFDGVRIRSGTGNLISRNSIFGHAGLGIDLGPDGITPNDALDPDTGANQLQNSPVITGANNGTGSTVVTGTLNSRPNKSFKIQVYHSQGCNGAGRGEGQLLLGTATVNTSGSGNGSFTLTSPFVASAGEVVTALATDLADNTSEFSPCFPISGNVRSANLKITKTDFPDPVQVGMTLTYTLTVQNLGSDASQDVRVTDILPAGLVLVTATPLPATRFGNTLNFRLGGLASGASTTVTIVATPTSPGTVINTATVSGGVPDPDGSNNSVSVSTLVEPFPTLHITRSGSQVILSWPAGAVGFNLEQTVNLAPSTWGPGPGPIVLSGTDKTVTVNNPGTGTRFYRLHEP